MLDSPLEHKNLKENARQYLAAIIESSDDAIISKSLDGTIISWNAAAQHIFGYTEKEIVGKNITILIPHDRQEEERVIIRRLIQGERIDHFETIRKRKDGSLVPISLTISPIRNLEGKVIGASKIARDITIQKNSDYYRVQAEDALARERNQLRVLIDALPDYIYFKDTESRFIDANNATLTVMGCQSVSEVIGKTDFDFYPKEFAKKYFDDERNILRTGEPKIDIEESLFDDKRRTRIISTSKVPLKDKIGNIIGLVGIGRDITERKKAEEILKRDNEAFEKIIKERTRELLDLQSKLYQAKQLSEIGTLAAMVAHELRNPLRVIAMSVDRLKKEPAFANNNYLKNIEAKVTDGDQIIDSLLNYSRIKPPTYEPFYLNALLDECISNSRMLFPDCEVMLERKYDPAVDKIEADPYQLKEVFMNLLNNAVQAFPQRSGKIEVSTQALKEAVKISIKDNGVGIPEEDLGKLFTPFFTKKSKGTGLGLAVCREIVQMHGGKIDVKSSYGEGAKFSITIPVKKP